jgi:predicted dehydrogenase
MEVKQMARIRVGIVGCGEVAQIIHLPSLYQLADLFEVTALCDVSAQVLNSVGDQWGIANRFQAYQDLVQQQNVDAVLVTNPHVYHTEVTLAAMMAGKHVLVEKPMSLSLQEADQIIAAQRKAGVVVQVGYMRRYAPAFQEALRRITELGTIGLARVHDLIGANSLIIRQTSRVIRGDDLSAESKAAARSLQNQRVEEALGGSVAPGLRRAYLLMLGLSSHDTSAMRELLGMPQRVLYTTWREQADMYEESEKAGGRYLTAAFDYGSFVCQFESGVDGIPRFDAHIEVFGANGVLKVQYDTPYVRNLPINLAITEANAEGGVTRQNIHPAWGDPFVIEWQDFYRNIQQQKEPKTNPTDFRKDLELFQAMARLLQEQLERTAP